MAITINFQQQISAALQIITFGNNNNNSNFGSFIAHIPVRDRSMRFTIK